MNSENFSIKLCINNQSYPVTHCKAYEALSRNFYAKLILYLEEPWENLQTLIVQNASLQLEVKEEIRFFNGFIIKVECSAFPNEHGFYELRLKLGSWPSLFRETREFQIFENKTVPEILASLFKTYPQCQFNFSQLSKHYKEIPYTVQYQESRLQFMRRLLNDAKIQSYFTHERNQHCLMFFDHTICPIKKLEPILISNWQTHYGLNSIVRYSMQTSYLNLNLNTEFHYQHQNYRIMGLKHEAYDFSHHNRSAPAVRNTQAYFNQSSLLKAENPYPIKTIAKASIQGVQTALITHINDAGVSLAYPWSRQPSTHSVPVVQLAADDEQNLQFPPLQGSEALLGFEAGDPERPLVLASCYNAAQAPPFNLTQASRAGYKNPRRASALSFNDEPDLEQISVLASQDYQESVDQNQSLLIQRDYQQTVEASAHLEVGSCEIEATDLLLQAGQSLIRLTNDEIVVQSDIIHLN